MLKSPEVLSAALWTLLVLAFHLFFTFVYLADGSTFWLYRPAKTGGSGEYLSSNEASSITLIYLVVVAAAALVVVVLERNGLRSHASFVAMLQIGSGLLVIPLLVGNMMHNTFHNNFFTIPAVIVVCVGIFLVAARAGAGLDTRIRANRLTRRN